MTERFPVMGKWPLETYVPFEIEATIKKKFDHPDHLNEALKNAVNSHKQKHDKHVFLFGGFHEKRDFYATSEHFGTNELRNIHLGIDVWAEPGTPIFSPEEGIVHSIKYNSAPQDYGWCLIIQYHGYFLLFGHLAEKTNSLVKVGDFVKKGQMIGLLGEISENGGWEPHLHLQKILDIGQWWGDYPGVCSEKDLSFYQANCPSPIEFILA